jgi:hypothetical protein
MRICIFTGPTLPPAEAASILDAEYLPPAAIGDVYKAAKTGPWAIGIIDGFFESTPSVWHKEVLWAMAQGIHVFGASSMGALRAAELADFGMIGVGAIFEAYRDGAIEDDDEVAVVHGPPELGYVQLNEAMVNIRATLAKATDTGVLSAATAAALTETAKSLYYKQRSYERLLAEATARRLSAEELDRLKAWLPANQVNQKRLDAIAMLRAIAEARAAALEPKPVSYVFEHTTLWEAVERQFGPAEATDAPAAAAELRNGVFDELRLEGGLYGQLRREALVRALARRQARDEGSEPTMVELQEATRRFRKRMGFQTPAELEAWLDGRGLDREAFMRLMADEARRRRLDDALAEEINEALIDELSLTDAFARLQARADEKHAVLRGRGRDEPTLADAGLSESELLDWYVHEYGTDAGTDDPGELAMRFGYADLDDLLRAALREYCYRAWKAS